MLIIDDDACERIPDDDPVFCYDPAEHRVRDLEARHPTISLGHECNTPTYVLDELVIHISYERPGTWSGKVSWRFPMPADPTWRLAIRPKLTHIATAEDEQRWLHWTSDDGPLCFNGPRWAWDNEFPFAVQCGRAILAGGRITSGICAGVTLTRFRHDQVDTILTAVAETIEALRKDQLALLAGEHDTCCFCGRALTEPRSRAVGYGPECAQHYRLPY